VDTAFQSPFTIRKKLPIVIIITEITRKIRIPIIGELCPGVAPSEMIGD
jgi:hypothetical protein